MATSLSKTILTPDQDAVVSEIEIAASPARVFAALTDADQLARWFSGGACAAKFWRMDPRLGGSYSYTTNPSGIPTNDASESNCHGEIIEFDPPRLLAYTWFGSWHLDSLLRTVVRWELTPTSAGTRVTVTHAGLAQDPASRKGYSGGWSGVLEHLQQFAEAGATE
jgi:uncharacterized protein YndB with AHSA1/START domain